MYNRFLGHMPIKAIKLNTNRVVKNIKAGTNLQKYNCTGIISTNYDNQCED